MKLFTVENQDHNMDEGGDGEEGNISNKLTNQVLEDSAVVGQVKNMSSNHENNNSTVFYIFQFMRWGYFVGIIPLKPVMKNQTKKRSSRTEDNFSIADGMITFKKNWFQKCMCGIIYISATIWTIAKLSSSYSEAGSLYARPSRILAIVSVLFQMMYVANFAYTFGLKATRFSELFHCGGALIQTKPWHYPSTEDGKLKRVVLSVLLPVVLFFLYLFPTLLQLPKYVEKIPGCMMTTNNTTYISSGIDCKTWQHFRYLICFSLIFSAELIYNSFLAFMLVLAVTGKEVAAKALQLLGENDPADYNLLLLKMEQIQKYFSALNQVGSVPFLCFLCQAISWTAYRLLDSLPNPKVTLASTTSPPISVGNNGSSTVPAGSTTGDIHNQGETLVKFYNWCVMSLFAIIIYFAAETKRIIQQFRDNLTLLILKREMNIITQQGEGSHLSFSVQPFPVTLLSSSFAPCKYVKETLKDSCIHGGPFFHFSYSFISTVIGIITTLILFELQFGKNEHSRFLTS